MAECGSAKVKVTKRVEQANASCETGGKDLTYTTPPRTYCIATPSDPWRIIGSHETD